MLIFTERGAQVLGKIKPGINWVTPIFLKSFFQCLKWWYLDQINTFYYFPPEIETSTI